MRQLLPLLLILFVMTNISCATSSSVDDFGVGNVDDEFDADLNSDSGTSDTGGDLEAELDQQPDPGAADNTDDAFAQFDNDTNATSDSDLESELDDVAGAPAAAPVPELNANDDLESELDAPIISESKNFSGEPVTVTGLDFNANEAGGTIAIQTSGTASYSTRKNARNQQFIVEIDQAQLPDQFKRPYNTKEFPGPIMGIQAYQTPGSQKARIVVQLRNDIEPVVRQVGGTIYVSPSLENLPATNVVADTPMSSKSVPSALSNEGLDAFLLNQSKFYGKRISMQFKDVDIRDVFNIIAEQSGLNILLSDDVTGKVTLKLRQVPWDQALVVLMKSRQLGYMRQGTVLRVAPLKALQQEADAARSVLDTQADLKPLQVKVFPVSYAKVNDLEIQAKDFLSKRGKVKADLRTNSLIVNDIDENLERISKLIEVLDTQTPQVLIESKVVEARQSFERRVGLNWSLRNGSIPTGSQNGSAISMRPEFNMAAADVSPISLGLRWGTFDYIGDIDATLNLYEAEGLVKVISAPRVVTLNGQKANIEQSTELPYKKVDQTSAGLSTSIQFKPIQLKLEVTPQITADGGVIMAVAVTREFPGSETGSGDFPVNRRYASTNVMVQNGQTSVMGGIFQSDVAEGESGVPFLRKIPILGSLFKHKTYRKDKNELLIFLTPRVLNKDKAFRQARGG